MTQYVSGRIGHGLVHQHDRDSIPNRVDPAALGTLQTLSFVLQRQRLFTDWADQDVEQVLRNHGGILRFWWRGQQSAKAFYRKGRKDKAAKIAKKKSLPVFFAIFAAFLCVLCGKVLSRQNDLR